MTAAVQRMFRGPTGRVWTAQLFTLPAPAGVPDDEWRLRARTMLRFSSADVVLDLVDWPDDWSQLPDEALVELVRRANPPRIG